MTEISLLKYIQWRPIGVCDTGKGKQRKAKMFSKVDLENMTSSEIGRGNWRKNKKVMKIISKYAHDLSQISALTKEMKNPEISEIKLVGAVLDLDQTPNLNQESLDGRVQFFQVSFRDSKIKGKGSNVFKFFFKRLVITFGIILTLIFVYICLKNFSELKIKKNYKSFLKCGFHRNNASYLDELKNFRKSLLDELQRLPEWLTLYEARSKCKVDGNDIKNQEKILLNCFFSVRNRTKDFEKSSLPNLKKVEICLDSLCKKNLNHLKSICKRF